MKALGDQVIWSSGHLKIKSKHTLFRFSIAR